MIVYGVNRGGKTIQVLGDFSIHIPYGYCYCIDENAASDASVLTVIKTAERLSDYTDGAFFIPDGTDCEVILPFRATHDVNVATDAKELDIDFEEFLRSTSETASNQTISMDFSFNGQSAGTKTLGSGDFRRRYRLVNNAPLLKAGYFTSGILGRTTYTAVMITRHHLYMATLRSSSMDYDQLEQDLDELLSGMAALDDNSYAEAQARQASASDTEIPANYKGKDGKLDAFRVAEWFCRDVLFSNDGDFLFDGTHHVMKGLQLNAASPQSSALSPLMDALFPEIQCICAVVEQNEKLMLPKSSFHKEILRATRDEPITGLTVLDLCAWHMLVLMRNSDDDYTAFVDTNLIKGIPNAYAFIGEFIRTLRHYNDQKEDFCVHFNLTNNLDSPCGGIDTPVSGAVCKRIDEITFGGKSGDTDTALPAVEDECASIPKEIEKYEASLDTNLTDVLKMEAATAKQKLDAFAQKVEENDFSRLRSIDGVIKRLMSIMQDDVLRDLDMETNYFAQRTYTTYSPAYSEISVEGDYLACGVSARFSSSPKELARNLVKRISETSVDELYLSLLKQVNTILEEGKTIRVRGSKVVGKNKEVKGEKSKEPQKPLRSSVQVTPPKNNPQKFVQVVECANPQSWVEKKPDAIERMQKELAALEEATTAATKKRENEKSKRFSALDDALKEKLELLDKSYEDAAAEIARQINEAKQQITELNNERSSLKWFNFFEKNRLKKEAEANELRITEFEKKQSDNEKQHVADVRKAKSANAREKQKIGREIDLQFPMPKETPEDIKKRAERRLKSEQRPGTSRHVTAARTSANENFSETQSSVSAMMDKVASFLNEHRWECFTVAELIARGVFPNATQSQRAASVCNKLVEGYRAEKGVLKGKTVFMAPGTFDTIEGIRPYRRV